MLHCASMVALGNERRELVMKVNVQGTQNIIDQCFAHPECKKLVYVGAREPFRNCRMVSG